MIMLLISVYNHASHFRAEYAIDTTLEQFREQNDVSDSSDVFLQRNADSDDKHLAEYKALPACDNDVDFVLLKQHLCNDGLMPKGPYLVPHDAFDGFCALFNHYRELAPADTSDEDDLDDEEEDKAAQQNEDAADAEE